MGYEDLLYYFKITPSEHTHSVGSRVKDSQYRYISYYSWCVLINQVLKVYFLGRVTFKSFMALKKLDSPSKKIPKVQLNGSNLYSPSEVILLRWCEIAEQKVRNVNKRLQNFDFDFRSGLPYASLIEFYTDGSVKPRRLKETTLRDDLVTNMRTVRAHFLELGLSPLLQATDLVE